MLRNNNVRTGGSGGGDRANIMMTRARWSGLVAAGSLWLGAGGAMAATDPVAVARHYADLGQAMYGDAASAAHELQKAVDALIAGPSVATLEAARAAWRAARPSYQQTEVFRFGNPIVDDWEGKVNAWPLDEGLIDYVAPAYGTESDANPLYAANVIANPVLKIGTETIDATTITPEVLQSLQDAGGVESNVAIGYHAVEFLLWGQDLHGTGPGAGTRPWTDYATDPACTNGHCDRRAAYLKAATTLLVSDLDWMAAQWAPGGEARKALDAAGPQGAVTMMLTGFGSLSYGELAGERMKLGLLLHDPEEEHDCFSDNTDKSHYNDIIGMQNIWHGRYKALDGTVSEGPSLATLTTEADPALATEVDKALAVTVAAAEVMVKRADTVEHYDQMIGPDNPTGNAVVQAVIDGLVAQSRVFERVVAALKLQPIAFEGSDSLDSPDAVFK